MFNRKPLHPLADLRAVRALVDALPPDNPRAAILEIARSLESLVLDAGFGATQRSSVIAALEEAGGAQLAEIAGAAIRTESETADPGKPAWSVAYEYYSALALAWRRALKEIAHNPRRAAEIPGLGASMLSAEAAQLRWGYAGYRAGEIETWQRCLRVYAELERRNIARARTSSISNGRDSASPQEALLRMLLLATAGPDGMDPTEIEIADRVADEVAGRCTLSTVRPENASYWIDLDSPHSPRRTVFRAPSSSGVRFVGTEAGERSALAASTAARLRTEFPEWRIARTLERLAIHWGPVPQERRGRRTPLTQAIRLTFGFDCILDLLDPLHSLDLHGSTHEEWSTADASSGGFLAVRDAQEPTTLRIGALVATQAADGAPWALGIVRRRQHTDGARLAAGIECIARRPAIAPVELTTEEGRLLRRDFAIVIDPAAAGASNQILTRAGFFRRGARVRLLLDGKTLELAPADKLARGLDFEILAVAKETAALTS
jgi:hypothetical protein